MVIMVIEMHDGHEITLNLENDYCVRELEAALEDSHVKRVYVEKV